MRRWKFENPLAIWPFRVRLDVWNPASIRGEREGRRHLAGSHRRGGDPEFAEAARAPAHELLQVQCRLNIVSNYSVLPKDQIVPKEHVKPLFDFRGWD